MLLFITFSEYEIDIQDFFFFSWKIILLFLFRLKKFVWNLLTEKKNYERKLTMIRRCGGVCRNIFGWRGGGFLSTQQWDSATTFGHQAWTIYWLNNVYAVCVSVRLAPATTQTLTTVTAQHLAATVTGCNFAISIFLPLMSALSFLQFQSAKFYFILQFSGGKTS